MKECKIRMRLELYNRLNLLAKEYNLSLNKMMIKLLEIGYLEMLGGKLK